jgi:hypothetical protein
MPIGIGIGCKRITSPYRHSVRSDQASPPSSWIAEAQQVSRHTLSSAPAPERDPTLPYRATTCTYAPSPRPRSYSRALQFTIPHASQRHTRSTSPPSALDPRATQAPSPRPNHSRFASGGSHHLCVDRCTSDPERPLPHPSALCRTACGSVYLTPMFATRWGPTRRSPLAVSYCVQVEARCMFLCQVYGARE